MEAIKQNRTASFIIVILVYVLATVAGVLVYRAVTLDWWMSLLIADTVATVVTFIFSLIWQRADSPKKRAIPNTKNRRGLYYL